MPNCGCRDTCSCIIQGAGSARVTGAGGVGNPYIITVDPVTPLQATVQSIDTHLGGDASNLVGRVLAVENNFDSTDDQLQDLITRMTTTKEFTSSGDVFATVDTTNWSITSINVVKWAKVATLYLVATRVGTAIASSASGDIANSTIGTLLPYLSVAGTNARVAMSSSSTGPVCSGGLTSSGILQLTAIPPGVGIAVGGTVSLGATWSCDTFASDDAN